MMNTIPIFYYKNGDGSLTRHAQDLLTIHSELAAIAVWNPARDGAYLHGSAPGIPVYLQELLAQLCLRNIFRRSAILFRQGLLKNPPSEVDEHQTWFSLSREGRLGLLVIPPACHFGDVKENPPVSPSRIDFISRYCDEDAAAIKVVERALSLNPNDVELSRFYFAYLQDSQRATANQERWETLQYLRCLQSGTDQVAAANELADYFEDAGKPFLSALFRVYSLAQKPEQIEIYKRFKKNWISGVFEPHIPQLDGDNQVMVSVLLCTYNRPERLGQALESVLSQTYSDFEVLVVNDGGDRAAEEIVKRCNSDKIRYFYGEHGGHRAALNIGLRAARGKYVAYLDDDDIYYPNHLETLVQAAERGSLDFACSRSRWLQGHWEADQWVEDYDLTQRDSGFQMKRMRISAYVTDNSILHRRSISEKVGLFWEEPQRGGEWEYWVRCSRFYKIERIESVTCECRVLTASLPLAQPARARLFTELWRAYFGSEFGYAALALGAYYAGEQDVFKEAIQHLSNIYIYLQPSIYERLWKILIQNNSFDSQILLSKMAKQEPVVTAQMALNNQRLVMRNLLRMPIAVYLYVLKYAYSHPRYTLKQIFRLIAK